MRNKKQMETESYKLHKNTGGVGDSDKDKITKMDKSIKNMVLTFLSPRFKPWAMLNRGL
jgi:hypothetical protein